MSEHKAKARAKLNTPSTDRRTSSFGIHPTRQIAFASRRRAIRPESQSGKQALELCE